VLRELASWLPTRPRADSVAQTRRIYGLDLYGKVRLAELLRSWTGFDGIEWIRIMYASITHGRADGDPARGENILTRLPSSTSMTGAEAHAAGVRLKTRRRLLARLRATIPALVAATTFYCRLSRAEQRSALASLADLVDRLVKRSVRVRRESHIKRVRSTSPVMVARSGPIFLRS